MREIVFASSNAGKIAELQSLLGPDWAVKSARDFPHIPEVVEDATTFEGNAAKKAHAFAQATGLWALADDSGLMVDALDGRPGVFSARYAPTEAQRIDKLLLELESIPAQRRTARFVCVLCLASPEGEERFTRGVCEGAIGAERKGAHGFGYDPIFVLPSGKTMSELTRDEKSVLSHRGHAFRDMLPHLISPGARRP